METTPTTIRLDDNLKKELNKELKSMGLSIMGRLLKMRTFEIKRPENRIHCT